MRRTSAGPAVLLLVATAVAYWNSLDGPFVFDDLPAIRDNASLRSLGDPVTVLSPPQNSGVGGRPLANLSFALNYAAGGGAVRGYHAVNLLLHLGSVLLLFGIVQRSVRAQPPRLIALAVALIWAVHPLTTAAVSYLSQRTELLMAFFYLLTLYAFIRSQATPARQTAWLAASVLACGAGMMSKESMVTAPVLVWLYDRTFVAGTGRAAFVARRRYYAALAGTWLILGYLLTTGLHQRSVGFGLGVSSGEYLLTEARAILLYLKLAFWPAPLVFDYGRSYESPALVTASSVIGVLILVGVAGWLMRRGSRWGFTASAIFLVLAPTSSVVPVAEQPIAENRMYLPLAALVACGVVAGHALLPGRARGTALGLLSGALVCLTVLRNETYQSATKLWGDTVQKRPGNPRAHFNFGVNLLDAGEPLAASRRFATAIALNPSDARPYNSLGNALLSLDRPAEAERQFAHAIRLDPTEARGWYNRGIARFRAGDSPGAITQFEHALQLDPKDAAVHDALGNAYFHLNRPADAIPHYERALQFDPTMADAHYNCGSACLELDRLAEAIAHFSAAAGLKPTDAEIRNNLGAALLRAGRKPEAIVAFKEALRLKPGYADAAANLATARGR